MNQDDKLQSADVDQKHLYPLQGTALIYINLCEPVALEDWEALSESIPEEL